MKALATPSPSPSQLGAEPGTAPGVLHSLTLSALVAENLFPTIPAEQNPLSQLPPVLKPLPTLPAAEVTVLSSSLYCSIIYRSCWTINFLLSALQNSPFSRASEPLPGSHRAQSRAASNLCKYPVVSALDLASTSAGSPRCYFHH